MTAPATATPSDFLLARIAEDEARVTDGAAGVATSYSGWHTVDCGVALGYWAVERCECRFVDRILVECAAKRRIAEAHTVEADEVQDDGTPDCPDCWQTWPCNTLRLLAAVYADHPDYSVEWKP